MNFNWTQKSYIHAYTVLTCTVEVKSSQANDLNCLQNKIDFASIKNNLFMFAKRMLCSEKMIS